MPDVDLDQFTETFPAVMNRFEMLLRQERAAGQPITIAINAHKPIVIDDDDSFEMLIQLADRLELIEALKQGLKDLNEGKTGLSLDEFDRQFRKKNGLVD